MDISHKVVEALSLAVNRLDEPSVNDAYRDLIAIVDTHLGAQTFGGGNVRALTEPQLVLISYGLKHLYVANSKPLIRATERLLAVLAGEPELEPEVEAMAVDEAETEPEDDEEEEPDEAEPMEPLEQERPPRHERRPARRPAPAPASTNVTQHIESIHGGNVSVVGIQTTHNNTQPAPIDYDDADADPDASDTSEIAAADTGKARKIPNDVFISYSRRNAEIMRRIRADLRSSGMSVWTDENLQPGTSSWRRAVEAAIRGARCMVVIMTPDSKESEWVEREVNAAKEFDIHIFPVLARGNPKTSIPLQLNSYQYVDVRKEEYYRTSLLRLIRAVRSEIKRKKH
ncbi:MAG: toll/interleukin-1 receptor domain-containing protein [Anaerolineae bacterium]|nr:toll/interleukin-1 receptor domain-containing protein [Anaerolineae bacterium]